MAETGGGLRWTLLHLDLVTSIQLPAIAQTPLFSSIKLAPRRPRFQIRFRSVDPRAGVFDNYAF
jgi:hypothetical protein